MTPEDLQKKSEESQQKWEHAEESWKTMTEEELDEFLGSEPIPDSISTAEKIDFLNQQIAEIEGEPNPEAENEEDKTTPHGGLMDLAKGYQKDKGNGDTYKAYEKQLKNKKKKLAELQAELEKELMGGGPAAPEDEEDEDDIEFQKNLEALGQQIKDLKKELDEMRPKYLRAKEITDEEDKKDEGKKLETKIATLEGTKVNENEITLNLTKLKAGTQNFLEDDFKTLLPKEITLDKMDFTVDRAKNGNEWKYKFEFVKTEGTTKTPLAFEAVLEKSGDVFKFKPVTLPTELQPLERWLTETTFNIEEETEIANKILGGTPRGVTSMWTEGDKFHIALENTSTPEKITKVLTHADYVREGNAYKVHGYAADDFTNGKVKPEHNPYLIIEKQSGLKEGDTIMYGIPGKEVRGIVKKGKTYLAIEITPGTLMPLGGLITKPGEYIAKVEEDTSSKP